jgi:riboflavin biosynthesis pyrimidine reductase
VRQHAELIACGTDGVDLSRALDALAERGLHRVNCEGGPRLITDLIVAGLLDELCLTVSPQLAGPGRARLTAGDEWTDARGVTLASVLEQDGELYLRYPRSRR